MTVWQCIGTVKSDSLAEAAYNSRYRGEQHKKLPSTISSTTHLLSIHPADDRRQTTDRNRRKELTACIRDTKSCTCLGGLTDRKDCTSALAQAGTRSFLSTMHMRHTCHYMPAPSLCDPAPARSRLWMVSGSAARAKTWHFGTVPLVAAEKKAEEKKHTRTRYLCARGVLAKAKRRNFRGLRRSSFSTSI